MPESAIVMCCSGRTSPLTAGLRHVQRAAIRSDPNYRDGEYWRHNVFPSSGLSVARQLAMLLYKSWDNFDNRFSNTAR
jgi:homoserine O-acetyltransferase